MEELQANETESLSLENTIPEGEVTTAEASNTEAEAPSDEVAKDAKPKKVKEPRDRVIAILTDSDGKVFTIAAQGLKEIKDELKNYPAEQLIEVWVGKRLKLKKQMSVSFTSR